MADRLLELGEMYFSSWQSRTYFPSKTNYVPTEDGIVYIFALNKKQIGFKYIRIFNVEPNTLSTKGNAIPKCSPTESGVSNTLLESTTEKSD